MKLHDLRPAPGSRTPRTRVGRGIAAGKGKTAGRGTKGQKARTGGTIQPWFEGGQTPIQIRVPKLRGFTNRFKVPYEVVNVGRISQYAELGRFGQAEGRPDAPVAVTPELLRATGLVGSLRYPVKVLGQGEVSRRLFVVADAFSASARTKIEGAGGTAQILEVGAETPPPGEPSEERPAAPSAAAAAAEASAAVEAVEAAERAAPPETPPGSEEGAEETDQAPAAASRPRAPRRRPSRPAAE